MNQWKTWLCDRFLPTWCREELLAENAKLLERVAALRKENDRLNAYISGLETAMRSQRRIVIKNEVSK